MIVPYSLVQLTDTAVHLYLIPYLLRDDYPVLDPQKRRRFLIKMCGDYQPLAKHPGILFLHPMSDDPTMGVFATHDNHITWGHPLDWFEPYDKNDHIEAP